MFNLISAALFDFSDIEIKPYLLVLTILAVIAVFAGIGFVVAIIQKKRGIQDKLSTKDIAYASICIAMAFALSFFGYTLPQGGTVTAFSTVPIIIYCYYFGFKKGVVVCSVNMLLQLLQNPYIVHPFSAVLDYMLPYLFLSVVGMFPYNHRRATQAKNLFGAHLPLYIGCVIYVVLRYASHVLSGIIFYADWAWEDYSLLGYSLAYNSFVLIDFAVAMVAVVALTANKAFCKEMSVRSGLVYTHDSATQSTDSTAN